ncbi:hypothetical protein AYO44_09730 [Planctomycetaceae bacterium SCGC AG-212-F19]|nr:hypothetical protein AYO44_09730 [Planctomycetaceae bacterium SCGC AG-212-F19]
MNRSAFAVGLSPSQLVVVLVLGILLFGKRMPEISRSLAKSLLEFKKGLVGIEADIADSLAHHERPARSPAPLSEMAPKFVATDEPGASPIA